MIRQQFSYLLSPYPLRPRLPERVHWIIAQIEDDGNVLAEEFGGIERREIVVWIGLVGPEEETVLVGPFDREGDRKYKSDGGDS